MRSLCHASIRLACIASVALVFLNQGTDAQATDKSPDPINNLCSRWQHSSVIKNGILYINGGAQTTKAANDIGQAGGLKDGPNVWLIAVDMTKSWNRDDDLLMKKISKDNNRKSGIYPPSSQRGTIFHGLSDDPYFYPFGGRTYYGNTEDPDFQHPDFDLYNLWSFDSNVDVKGLKTDPWTPYSMGKFWRPNYGAAAEATDQGLGFYLNGQIDRGTSATVEFSIPTNQTFVLDGMMVIDLAKKTAKNVTTASIQKGIPRVGGGLQYVPYFGSRGILTAFGGLQRFANQMTAQNTGNLLSFDSVDIFDIASLDQTNASYGGAWYTQKTSGEMPEPRIDFCNVLISAPDNSSHNIYVHGGWNPLDKSMYDDVYVLSLPSFTWTKVFEGIHPRWGHTCHLVGNRQLLTIGGITSPGIRDQCDWKNKTIGVGDMTTLTWGPSYNANAEPYQLPGNLTAIIGGSGTGGAKLKRPVTGYTNPGLEKVLTARRSTSSPTSPTSPNSNPSSGHTNSPNIGAIAGGATGGAVLLVAILSLFFFCRRRRNHNRDHALPTHHLHEAPQSAEAYQLTDDMQKQQYELGTPYKPTELEGMHPAVELPGYHLAPGGVAGMPMIQTTAPTPVELEGSPPLGITAKSRPKARPKSRAASDPFADDAGNENHDRQTTRR